MKTSAESINNGKRHVWTFAPSMALVIFFGIYDRDTMEPLSPALSKDRLMQFVNRGLGWAVSLTKSDPATVTWILIRVINHECLCTVHCDGRSTGYLILVGSVIVLLAKMDQAIPDWSPNCDPPIGLTTRPMRRIRLRLKCAALLHTQCQYNCPGFWTTSYVELLLRVSNVTLKMFQSHMDESRVSSSCKAWPMWTRPCM